MDARGIRSFHHYLRDALRCEDVYGSIAQAFQELRPNSPVLTIFGERNDPFGFQKRWTGIFPQAQRLVVRNGNPTVSEFESTQFHREKVVPPGQEITVFVGPLDPGSYEFFDDFHPDTRGHLVVK